MREKDLKIKKPKRELKTLDKNFKMKAVQRKFLIDKFKSDKNREDETAMSEASNNAQDEFEDTFISTGLYAAEKLSLNNTKKKTKQNEQTNNFKRNYEKNSCNSKTEEYQNLDFAPKNFKNTNTKVNLENKKDTFFYTDYDRKNMVLKMRNLNRIDFKHIRQRPYRSIPVKNVRINWKKDTLIKRLVAKNKKEMYTDKNVVNTDIKDENNKYIRQTPTVTNNTSNSLNRLDTEAYYQSLPKRYEKIKDTSKFTNRFTKKHSLNSIKPVNKNVNVKNNKHFAPEKEYKKFLKKSYITKYQKTNPIKTGKKIGFSQKAMKAAINTTAAFVKSIIAILSSLSASLVVFVIIAAVIAIISTSFGIFYSLFDNSEDVKKVSQIVAETNSEFNNKVEDIKNSTDYDSIEYRLLPRGEDGLFITNWTQVVAVFAVKTALDSSNALDVVTMDSKREEMLKDIFWDMNELYYETKEIQHNENSDQSTDTETVLCITLKSKSYEEMADYYNFSQYQKQALYETMKPEYAQMLSELVGTYGIAGGSIELTEEQIQNMIANLPDDLPPERKAVMNAAYSLVGKVNYFWGGKSEVIGWDSRWGTPMKVTAAGSNTTGMTLPFGLDCSGFVTWAFINATGDTSYANTIGHGAANQYSRCEKIDWSEAQAGDLVFYPDLGHVGIIVGKDENGNILVVHCASSQNNVVVTGLQGFTKVGRPQFFN